MMKVIIVGASRGLGLALQRAWLERGAEVTALNRDSSSATPSERLRTLAVDVRSEPQFEAAARELSAENQGFDVLMYNAAIHLENARPDLFESDIDSVTATLDVNAVGAVRAVKHLRPLLRDSAKLVLISSEAGSIGQSGRTCEYGYCMSKAALNMLGKLLANRERARGSRVQVSCVHPGWLRTDMGGPNAHDSAEDAARDLVDLTLMNQAPARMYTDRMGAPLEW